MNPVPDLSQRTRRYWMIDGLPELLIGSIFLFTGLAQLAPLVAPANIAGWANLLLPLVLLPLILLGRRILHALKMRITYPRTGYVAYHQPPRWQRALGGLAGIGVGIALANLTFNAQLAAAMMPALTGFTLAAGLGYLGAYLGMRRFYALAAFVAALGLLMYWMPIDGFLGASLVIAAAGVWMLIAGSVTLYHYLQHTQIEA
ncbi:hypothetical protein A6A03_05575 [Chloroflexus islandicus]|uniref:Uncharacterized protein n=1 Tax=Chloroflexus islandicus TaxID=1707952 RepID=A0A178LSY4_9CHLR|nr:hypothetical protein [Chloroflexus islandicus]OAN37112.1 hypothetical protein A6A03_05575 [Chloroflexus islandicus]